MKNTDRHWTSLSVCQSVCQSLHTLFARLYYAVSATLENALKSLIHSHVDIAVTALISDPMNVNLPYIGYIRCIGQNRGEVSCGRRGDVNLGAIGG